MIINITDKKINITDATNELLGNADMGGVATFIGTVRGDNDLKNLNLEHYPNMTEKQLQQIATTAQQKFDIDNIVIIHRVGEMKVGEEIVFVGANSPHRQDCQNCVSFIMDFLKTQAPFWKLEKYNDGSEKWVEQKQSDLDKESDWK